MEHSILEPYHRKKGHAWGFGQGTGTEASPSQVSAPMAALLQLSLPQVGAHRLLPGSQLPEPTFACCVGGTQTVIAQQTGSWNNFQAPLLSNCVKNWNYTNRKSHSFENSSRQAKSPFVLRALHHKIGIQFQMCRALKNHLKHFFLMLLL